VGWGCCGSRNRFSLENLHEVFHFFREEVGFHNQVIGCNEGLDGGVVGCGVGWWSYLENHRDPVEVLGDDFPEDCYTGCLVTIPSN